MAHKEPTKDRIITAAIELATERGFKGATTKAIAERAEVNEVTLFRHFGHKKGIIEAVIERYAFTKHLAEVLSEQITGDVQKDLQMMARFYQEQLEKKREIILLSYREAEHFPELNEQTSKIPLEYKRILSEYLTEMMAKGQVKEADANLLASSFIYMNIGYFFIKSRLLDDGEVVSIDQFINDNVAQFIQSLL